MDASNLDADERHELAGRQYAAGLLNRRIAANVEKLNEVFTEISGEPGFVTLLCACGRDECDQPTVTLSLDHYRIVRSSRHRFAVAAGHATEIDDVIYGCPEFEIVEIRPEYRRSR